MSHLKKITKLTRQVTILVILLPMFAIASPNLSYGQLFEIDSKNFKSARRYAVALPERYHLDDYLYPTLYVIDGDFQFHHVSNVVKHLARMGKIPPMIVVGVANQGNSDYLLSNTWATKDSDEFGGVEKFQRFLYQELLPAVDQQFRTNNKKALAGYSLGGLFVLQSYLDKATPFNAFLAMSPSVWYDDYSLVKRYQKKLTAHQYQAPIFISLADEQGMGVNELVEVFNQAKAKITQWQFKNYPDESHYTTALPALYDGLQFLAPNYFIGMSQLMKQQDYQSALGLFDEHLKAWADFRFSWLQSYTFAKYVFASKQQHLALPILALVEKRFPESHLPLTIDIALGFNRKSMHQDAKTLLLTIEQQSQKNPFWHYQMSLAELGLGHTKKAKLFHQQALKLAKAAQLESWEIWEMDPNKFLP